MKTLNYLLLLMLCLSVATNALALSPTYQDLVMFETRFNAMAEIETQFNPAAEVEKQFTMVDKQSADTFPVEHFEIPLRLVRQNISNRLPENIRSALIFDKDGQQFLRWIINPADKVFVAGVEEFLRKNHVPTDRHHYFKGYRTSSRSIILENETTGVEFSAKISSSTYPGAFHKGGGGRWSFKENARSRKVADYILEESKRTKFTHLNVMDEPAGFSIAEIDQAMTIRVYPKSSNLRYLPGFAALHGKLGKAIAKENGSSDPEHFWSENYSKLLAKGLSELALLGLAAQSPHSQNFLIEMNPDLTLTGRIFLRDLGDMWLNSKILLAKKRADLVELFLQTQDIWVLYEWMDIGYSLTHGSLIPSWFSKDTALNWKNDFQSTIVDELSKRADVNKDDLKSVYNLEMNNSAYRWSYSISPFDRFIDLLKKEVEARELNETSIEGSSPLHRAASQGDLATVKLLAAQNADLNALDQDGFAPLHKATLSGHVEVVKYLLDQGANINVQDRVGYTPLAQAMYSNQFDIAQFLVTFEAQAADPFVVTKKEYGGISLPVLVSNVLSDEFGRKMERLLASYIKLFSLVNAPKVSAGALGNQPISEEYLIRASQIDEIMGKFGPWIPLSKNPQWAKSKGAISPVAPSQELWVTVMGNNPSEFKEEKYCPDTYKEVVIHEKKIGMCPDFPVNQVRALSHGQKDSDEEFIQELNHIYAFAGKNVVFRRHYHAEFHWADTEGNPEGKHNLAGWKQEGSTDFSKVTPYNTNQPRSFYDNEPNKLGFRRSGVCEWFEDASQYKRYISRGHYRSWWVYDLEPFERPDLGAVPGNRDNVTGPGRLVRFEQ